MQPKVYFQYYVAPKHQRGCALQNHQVIVKLGCRNTEVQRSNFVYCRGPRFIKYLQKALVSQTCSELQKLMRTISCRNLMKLISWALGQQGQDGNPLLAECWAYRGELCCYQKLVYLVSDAVLPKPQYYTLIDRMAVLPAYYFLCIISIPCSVPCSRM